MNVSYERKSGPTSAVLAYYWCTPSLMQAGLLLKCS